MLLVFAKRTSTRGRFEGWTLKVFFFCSNLFPSLWFAIMGDVCSAFGTCVWAEARTFWIFLLFLSFFFSNRGRIEIPNWLLGWGVYKSILFPFFCSLRWGRAPSVLKNVNDFGFNDFQNAFGTTEGEEFQVGEGTYGWWENRFDFWIGGESFGVGWKPSNLNLFR